MRLPILLLLLLLSTCCFAEVPYLERLKQLQERIESMQANINKELHADSSLGLFFPQKEAVADEDFEFYICSVADAVSLQQCKFSEEQVKLIYEVRVESKNSLLNAWAEWVDSVVRVRLQPREPGSYHVWVYETVAASIEEDAKRPPHSCPQLIATTELTVQPSTKAAQAQTQKELCREVFDFDGDWFRLNTNICYPPHCVGNLSALGEWPEDMKYWVYRPRNCYLKIYSREEARSCLNGKWLLFEGDSNNIDTVRHLISASFDPQFTKSKSSDLTFSYEGQTLRVKRLSNTGKLLYEMNGVGLTIYDHPRFQTDYIDPIFANESAPDYAFVNSGLHDQLCKFCGNMSMLEKYDRQLSLQVPRWKQYYTRSNGRTQVVWRNTVCTGAAFRCNPERNPAVTTSMNEVAAKHMRGVFPIIDFFDMSAAFRWDKTFTNGGHYGLPLDFKHEFVDKFLAHVHINLMCNHIKLH